MFARDSNQRHQKHAFVEARSGSKAGSPHVLRRIIVCIGAVLAALLVFYSSLILTSEPLSANEEEAIEQSIVVLEEAGFTEEVFYLRNFAAFRSSDHWLNDSVPKENAYAATNYPFAVITVYPDFFLYTKDKTERAAILLHEARHVLGEDEPEAYAYVWKKKKALGWVKEDYRRSVVFREIRKQTAEYAPNLFVCNFNEFNDCYE